MSADTDEVPPEVSHLVPVSWVDVSSVSLPFLEVTRTLHRRHWTRLVHRTPFSVQYKFGSDSRERGIVPRRMKGTIQGFILVHWFCHFVRSPGNVVEEFWNGQSLKSFRYSGEFWSQRDRCVDPLTWSNVHRCYKVD